MILKTTTIIDWVRPVQDLLRRIQAAGFDLLRVDNGGDEDENVFHKNREASRKLALEEITATDESRLWISRKGGRELVVLIVLGNAYHELPADWSVNPDLDKVLEEFSEHWEDRSYREISRHTCECEATGVTFFAQEGERTDLCPEYLRKQKHNQSREILGAYQELTGYTEISKKACGVSPEEAIDLHVGFFNTVAIFLEERLRQEFEEEIHEFPHLWEHLLRHTDWESWEDELFSLHDYSKVLFNGRVHVFRDY